MYLYSSIYFCRNYCVLSRALEFYPKNYGKQFAFSRRLSVVGALQPARIHSCSQRLLLTLARLQELGPRFTLRLRWLQDGTFDTKFGAYEWLHRRKQMDVSRRKFHL